MDEDRDTTQRLLESVTTAATAPLGLPTIIQPQLQQQHHQQNPQQQQPLSRSRFLIDRCSGICSLLLTVQLVILIFLFKNEGVNHSVSELANFTKEIFVNTTLSLMKKNMI